MSAWTGVRCLAHDENLLLFRFTLNRAVLKIPDRRKSNSAHEHNIELEPAADGLRVLEVLEFFFGHSLPDMPLIRDGLVASNIYARSKYELRDDGVSVFYV